MAHGHYRGQSLQRLHKQNLSKICYFWALRAHFMKMPSGMCRMKFWVPEGFPIRLSFLKLLQGSSGSGPWSILSRESLHGDHRSQSLQRLHKQSLTKICHFWVPRGHIMKMPSVMCRMKFWVSEGFPIRLSFLKLLQGSSGSDLWSILSQESTHGHYRGQSLQRIDRQNLSKI